MGNVANRGVVPGPTHVQQVKGAKKVDFRPLNTSFQIELLTLGFQMLLDFRPMMYTIELNRLCLSYIHYVL